jgi:hypothetical protein
MCIKNDLNLNLKITKNILKLGDAASRTSREPLMQLDRTRGFSRLQKGMRGSVNGAAASAWQGLPFLLWEIGGIHLGW